LTKIDKTSNIKAYKLKNAINMSENKKKNQFVEMEEEVLDFWDKSKIFKQSVEKKAPKGDYVFYDGPPFATGSPHYGHLVGSIIKDVVPRFWTMRGYKVERRWGWDCHGLPIENIVEKELGTKNKKQIEEEVGVEKFNEACCSKVLSYTDEWRKVIDRLGRFVDMDNAYKTMDLDYMESIWAVFKNLWDKDLIYKDYRSMHVCPRCETTLSQSEVTEGYQDIKDLSVIAKFELENEKDTYILAWTTTPWTLPGNVALAVGEDIDYVELRIKNEELRIILAKERIEEILKDKEYEIVKELKGKELIGKKYKPVFDNYYKKSDLENKENGWKIYSADFVTTEEGTGIVHIAPAFGEDDMAMGKEYNLPFVQHLGMDGVMTDEMGELAGKNVKPIDDHMATDVLIIKDLAHKGLLFHKEKYEHSYPHCWRCDTPLLNYATSSWFIKVKKLKGESDEKLEKGQKTLLETAKEINWVPDHIKDGRFGKWLEGARDWSISRQRFWASVMPIWECECGELKVVGGVEELEKLSGQKVTDLHKHVVDKVTFPCEKCKKTMKRIPDVLDCWFESGSMPYAQLHYPFENSEKIDNRKGYPAEFIAEGSDQTRAWFYYLHVIAGGTQNSHAFNNVIVNGIVLAEDGKKMSKRLQNYPDPMYLFDTYGADALRYYLSTSPVMTAENLNFSEQGVLETSRKLNNILWNVYKFYEMYCHFDRSESGVEKSLEVGEGGKDKGSLGSARDDKERNILDKWIVARLNQLIAEVTEGMEKYDLPKASRPIIGFIDDLSTWYLRRSRDRFKGDDEKDKKAALDTLSFVFVELSKIMAPFTPFIAETLYQKVTGYNFEDKNKSVHLEQWPTTSVIPDQDRESSDLNISVLDKMSLVRKAVELGLSKRDEAGIKVRQPLAKMTIRALHLTIVDSLSDEYIKLIKDELNIKEIEFINDENEDDIKVELDTKLTSELIAEGTKREVVRFINAMRKNNDLTIEDRIDIFYKTKSVELKKAIEQYKDDIAKDTLADSVKEGEPADAKAIADESEINKEVEINKNKITLSIIKK